MMADPKREELLRLLKLAVEGMPDIGVDPPWMQATASYRPVLIVAYTEPAGGGGLTLRGVG